MKLPLKLTLFVVLLFSVVIATLLLWNPIKKRWLAGKLNAGTIPERRETVFKLLEMGVDGEMVIEKYLAEHMTEWEPNVKSHMMVKTMEWVIGSFGKPGKMGYKTGEGEFQEWKDVSHFTEYFGQNYSGPQFGSKGFFPPQNGMYNLRDLIWLPVTFSYKKFNIDFEKGKITEVWKGQDNN